MCPTSPADKYVPLNWIGIGVFGADANPLDLETVLVGYEWKTPIPIHSGETYYGAANATIDAKLFS